LARECRVYIHDLALRLGVPVRGAGLADNPKIGYAKSIVDYIFRWLELKFIYRRTGGALQGPSGDDSGNNAFRWP